MHTAQTHWNLHSITMRGIKTLGGNRHENYKGWRNVSVSIQVQNYRALFPRKVDIFHLGCDQVDNHRKNKSYFLENPYDFALVPVFRWRYQTTTNNQ